MRVKPSTGKARCQLCDRLIHKNQFQIRTDGIILRCKSKSVYLSVWCHIQCYFRKRGRQYMEYTSKNVTYLDGYYKLTPEEKYRLYQALENTKKNFYHNVVKGGILCVTSQQLCHYQIKHLKFILKQYSMVQSGNKIDLVRRTLDCKLAFLHMLLVMLLQNIPTDLLYVISSFTYEGNVFDQKHSKKLKNVITQILTVSCGNEYNKQSKDSNNDNEIHSDDCPPPNKKRRLCAK